ncbi:nicotinamide-nucleotide amidohydrolase family protein [Chryseolinea sp. H1M3-3]|uniref:CinA family protein n=1 Tax=Chryseolinea sp. H1M3-3 TaxID=3034144 RepID=UPI0023EB7F71|nr:nicotinamide-nucleotide amidohydrolase family protein [Chryseolinea sp. H1M3-3]
MYDSTVINALKDVLIKRDETIAVAESVTAGFLQAALSSAENASNFFQGGITAYNIGQKARHLHIEPIHAERCNCVSDRIAAQMALEVTQLFASDWGIAVTGYAAPVPECSINDLFAYYAVSYRGTLKAVEKIKAKKDDPMKVQVFYVNQILNDFHRLMMKDKNQSSFSINDLNSINSKFASAGPLSTSPSIE